MTIEIEKPDGPESVGASQAFPLSTLTPIPEADEPESGMLTPALS